MNHLIKNVIFILLFLLILATGYCIDLDHQWARFLRAGDHSHQLEASLKQTHQKILQTDQYKYLLSKTRAEFDQAKAALPDADNIQSFINTTIIQSGKNQGLKFLTVNPQSSTAKDFYHIIPVQLVILGTYQQFSDFLKLLNTQHYFIHIDDFSMTRQQPAGTTVLKNNENTPDGLIINATADFYYF